MVVRFIIPDHIGYIPANQESEFFLCVSIGFEVDAYLGVEFVVKRGIPTY